MATSPETIFVPINFNTYKNNKINGLKTQLYIKKSLILLKQIEETKKLKNAYNKELKKTFSELAKEMKKFQDRLPKQKEKRMNALLESHNMSNQPISKIDCELKAIQEKLEALNNA